MHLLLGEINVKAEYKIKLARSLSTVGTGWVTAGTLKYVFEWQLIKKKNSNQRTSEEGELQLERV